MKKDTLYEIYSLLKDDTTKITDSLFKLMLLNSGSEETFLKFCRNNCVDSDTFDYFINISECLDDIGDKEIRDDLINSVIDISNDDYIKNFEDYDYILESIIFLLDFEYIKAFDMSEDYEMYYYKSIVVNEFIRFLKSLKNIETSKLYNHDMAEIIDSYRMVLGGLYNTTTNSNTKTQNQMYIDRIRYFIDIISDKDIYEISESKFVSVLNVIKYIENIEELKSFKNLIKINRAKDSLAFIEEIDNKSSDINELTIARINDEIGLERKYDSKKQETIITRDVNNPEEELDIIKKVLKPLD